MGKTVYIDKDGGKIGASQVEVANEKMIVRKNENVVEKTKGTIKNLDLKTIKQIAESEELSEFNSLY